MVSLVHSASCLRCEWRADGASADPQAEAHTKRQGHPTVVSGVPASVGKGKSDAA